MFGFRNWSISSFSGSISNEEGQSADIEMDGSGYIHKGRKVWRFRFKSGEVSDSDDLQMTVDDRSRPVRIASDPDDSDYGYIELL